MREAAKYYEENLKMFGPLRLVRALTDEQIEIMADPTRAPHAKLPEIEDAVSTVVASCAGHQNRLLSTLKRWKNSTQGLIGSR